MTGIVAAVAFAALTAALVTSGFVDPVRRIAMVLGAVDRPGGRREQKHDVPRMGGIAIVVGITLGITVALVSSGAARDGMSRFEIAALGVSCLLVFLLGAADDIRGVSPVYKILIEVIAAWVLVQAGWRFEVLNLPFAGEVELGAFGVALSLLWIVGVTNAINLLDGLDGLASGVVAIIAASFLVLAAYQGAVFTSILLAAVVGGCLGFLRHNWNPARIFMGDSGSLTLGFLLAAESVHASLKAPTAVAIFVPILALGVPVQDTLAVMGVRFMEQPKSSLLQRALRVVRADRNHLHHLLSTFGHKHKLIVLEIYGLVLVSCLFALTVALTSNPTLGLILISLELVVILTVRQLGLRQVGRKLAKSKLDELKADYHLGDGETSEPDVFAGDHTTGVSPEPALHRFPTKPSPEPDGGLAEAGSSRGQVVGIRSHQGNKS